MVEYPLVVPANSPPITLAKCLMDISGSIRGVCGAWTELNNLLSRRLTMMILLFMLVDGTEQRTRRRDPLRVLVWISLWGGERNKVY